MNIYKISVFGSAKKKMVNKPIFLFGSFNFVCSISAILFKLHPFFNYISRLCISDSKGHVIKYLHNNH